MKQAESFQPLVSIIISTYNRSNILIYTIKSVLNQSYQNFEILVIGDCCTDNTQKLVESFNDSRITFFNLPQNHGEQSYPNWQGFTQSKGELIVWLNHDDLLFSDHLQKCIENLYATKSDLVYTYFLPYKAYEHTPFYRLNFINNKKEYNIHTFVPASSWLLTRDLANKIGPWTSAWELRIAPSQDWIRRVYTGGFKINVIPDFSVIAIQSGIRKNSYKLRLEEEHKIAFEKLNSPHFKAEILAELAIEISVGYNNLTLKKALIIILRKNIYKLSQKLSVDSTTFISFLTNSKKKGDFIENLRLTRGLPTKKT